MSKDLAVFIEWTQGVIRGGPGCIEFPAPYNFVCSVIKYGDEAYLMGAGGKVVPEIWICIGKELRKIGVRLVHFERIKDGVRRWITIDLYKGDRYKE